MAAGDLGVRRVGIHPPATVLADRVPVVVVGDG